MLIHIAKLLLGIFLRQKTSYIYVSMVKLSLILLFTILLPSLKLESGLDSILSSPLDGKCDIQAIIRYVIEFKREPWTRLSGNVEHFFRGILTHIHRGD
jgi:hypothetical protein